MDRLLKSFLAGLAGTLAHLTLSCLKSQLGILPAFQPYDELQRGLAALTGASVSVPIGYALTFVNGALIWGFVFARLFRWLPGRTPLRKGLFFAFCAWAVSGIVFFPAMGRGPFAWGLGLGAGPALLMLVMLSVYSCTMSFVWSALTHPAGARRP